MLRHLQQLPMMSDSRPWNDAQQPKEGMTSAVSSRPFCPCTTSKFRAAVVRPRETSPVGLLPNEETQKKAAHARYNMPDGDENGSDEEESGDEGSISFVSSPLEEKNADSRILT
mmetsp:Transcript_22796/g.50807  ORF Transcript_22796/g.50807 Transcript_22796/m.50807 type:complete len:114 (-) Transcript_22796:699-1040(-)